MTFFTFSLELQPRIRFRYGEDITIIDFGKGSLKVDLFLAGETSDVSFGIGLWHSLVETFGR